MDFARRADLRLNLYLDDTLVVDEVDERVEYYLTIAQVEPEVVDDLMQALERGEPTKCLLVGEPGQVAELLPRMQAAFPDLQISRSKPRFIEVTRRGIRKDVALAAVAERFGIRMEDVMAVGDGDNDAAMLAGAGIGVAVANASAKAKEAAAYVAAGARGAGVVEPFAGLCWLERPAILFKPSPAALGAGQYCPALTFCKPTPRLQLTRGRFVALNEISSRPDQSGFHSPARALSWLGRRSSPGKR